VFGAGRRHVGCKVRVGDAQGTSGNRGGTVLAKVTKELVQDRVAIEELRTLALNNILRSDELATGSLSGTRKGRA